MFYDVYSNVLGTNRGPTDRKRRINIQIDNVDFLQEKQHLRKPPHAFDSELAINSDTAVMQHVSTA